ncbi:MAG: helix-turn-helix domain-containing protein [Vicingaceae bacterium]
MRKKIKSKIKENDSINSFAEKVGATKSQLYNFLNGKTGINTNTLEKILDELKLEINEPLPYVMESRMDITFEGERYIVGERYSNMEIKSIYTHRNTHILIVLEENGEENIRILRDK